MFAVPRSGVLRLDDDAFVSETRFDETVLRHYAFANEWFTVNVTFDGHGHVVETASSPDHPAFAFNCDIATPMRREGDSVYTIDLFADVLVRRNGQTFEIKDEEELEHAVTGGLVSGHEFDSAQLGIERLVGLIESEDLIPFLEAVCPFGPSHAPEGLPVIHVPVSEVPWLQRHRR